MSSSFSAPRAPKASQSGIPIVADTRQLSRLSRDLRRAAPEAWAAYRVAARVAAEPVLRDAKARASATGPKGTSVSSRVADSLKIVVTSGGNVKIVGGGDVAPDAAPIENRGRGFVRHPTFGRRDGKGDWTSKNSRPAFLAPALAARQDAVLREIEDAVVAAVERAIGGR